MAGPTIARKDDYGDEFARIWKAIAALQGEQHFKTADQTDGSITLRGNSVLTLRDNSVIQIRDNGYVQILDGSGNEVARIGWNGSRYVVYGRSLQTEGGQPFKVFPQGSDPGASDSDGSVHRIWLQET